MKIQYCGSFSYVKEKSINSVYTNIKQYEDFANYDLNIINFNDAVLWENNKTNSINKINKENDVKHILNSVRDEENKKVLILLPKNLTYRYNYISNISGSGKFHKFEELRNCIDFVIKTLQIPEVEFHPTETRVGDIDIKSDFYFHGSSQKNILTKSKNSNKITTINYSNIYYTTLNIDSEEKLSSLIGTLFLDEQFSDAPSWIEDFNFYNDKELKNNLKCIENKIQALHDKKEDIAKKITINSKFKSALYLSSSPLENIVREILGNIFDTDLSNWEETGEHDFLVIYNDCILIGDVKGTKNNAKRQYVSQIDEQNEIYCENNNVDPDSTIKLGVFNTFMGRSIKEREPFDKDTIKKASKSEVLMITTVQLLKIYDDFLSKKMTSSQIIEELRKCKKRGVMY